jgi:CHAT domain-containing protein
MSIRLRLCAVFVLFALSASAGLLHERAIEQGETHEERLELPAHQFVTLDVLQYDLDLEARVLDPGGAELLRATLEYDTRLSFITPAAGVYRLELKPIAGSPQAGTVSIALLESRSAMPDDQRRLDAQHSLLEAVLLLRARAAPEAKRAIEPLHRAIGQWRALGDCRGEMWATSALAWAYGAAQDNPASIKLFREAIAMQRELGEQRGLSSTLRGLGSVIWKTEPATARILFEEAAAISHNLSFFTGEAEARLFIGMIEMAAGEHRTAVAHFEQARGVALLARDPAQEALIANYLGVSLGVLGEWSDVLTYLHSAVPLYRRVGDKRNLGATLQNIGAAYGLLGEHRDALAQFALVQTIVAETGDRRLEATNRVNSGVSHGELGELLKARQELEAGLGLALELDDFRLEALAHRHLGRLDDKQQRPREALAHHERSLMLQQAIANRRGEAFALLNIGTLHRKLGNADEARRSILASHAFACELEDRGLEAATRLALARVDAQTGELESAWRELDAAMSTVESLRVNVAGQHLRGAYQLTLREYYELAIDVLMRMHGQQPERGFAVLALQTSERARARGLLDLLAEAKVDVRQGGDPQLLARERTLRRALNDKAALASRSPKKSLSRDVDALVSELREVEGRIRASSSRYASLTQPVPLTLREIQRDVLDPDTLLIELALGEERSYLWAVTSQSVDVRELPSRRAVEAIARRFYEALTERNTPIENEAPKARLARLARAKKQLARDGARLHDLLLARLPLRGKTRLLIVADGALQYVPFAAIPGRDGQPLIARYEIVSMPSVSALAALRRETTGRRVPERTVAVLADPVFAGPGMPRLPLTRDEAASIARLVPGAEVRTGYDATRAAAMSGDLRHFRYIHFATHGVIDDRHPELSGIVLSLVDEHGKPQDGFLRLHDIYNLELPADLVVLSACQTALGKEVAHEGLVGLTRGFMYAGAERVLASLWKIDDRATAELMRRFYERMMLEELTPAAALRAVQVEMARSPRWSDPYNWAAFVLQGEWRP